MGKITNTLTVGNIISVSFYNAAPERDSFYFFGSLAAIFEAFTPEQVGCTLEHLWNKDRFRNGRVITPTCIIAKHKIFRKANKVSRTTKTNKQ